MHSGQTNNKPQFHLGRTECPVVSSLRWTMCVTDRYVKASCSVGDKYVDLNKLGAPINNREFN
jgi:hypothetical protein